MTWPPLPLTDWQETYSALHLWTQILGKIRMTLSPPINHWWHVSLYVDARGLSTGPIPYPAGLFEIQLDFIEHQLRISTTEGTSTSRPLKAESVADFYRATLDLLNSLGIKVTINPKPQELPNPILFEEDHAPRPYDADASHRFWQILVLTSKVMAKFRGKFIGKCSPVHFFWGSFDLACTRFSGRKAPPRPGSITGPAYSHEVYSCGFWPGGGSFGPSFYAYAAPSPAGLERAPDWNVELSEFVVGYDQIRESASPEEALMDFFESTYQAVASLAQWDRAALEA